MKIVEFESRHIPAARKIAEGNLKEERKHVPALPFPKDMPDLTGFCLNRLGVAAFEGEEMAGFLCCHNPRERAFGSAARGIFSPIHAHGAVSENRGMIYKRMYEAAAKTWLRQKISYHSIALYAHDATALKAFFEYGFGMRCVDAVRELEPIPCEPVGGVTYRELTGEEQCGIRPLRRMLAEHMGKSPCFMCRSAQQTEAGILQKEESGGRVFAAWKDGRIAAYLEISEEGENFITETAGMKNICGAFCLPEFRGMGIYQNLINAVALRLREEGNQCLGVDFESFNPTAGGFWNKYFAPYTHSVVRRIDECAMGCEEERSSRGIN